MSRHLTYSNVVATLALFVALGGGALAVSKVGSDEIRNGSIKSKDLKNHAAVDNRDVKANALRGKVIAEGSLDASHFAPLVGDEGPDCHPASGSVFVDCAKVTVASRADSRLLVIATGNEETLSSVPPPAAANCEVRIDGSPVGNPVTPGEHGSANTDTAATNGFARTFVSRGTLSSGQHKVALACARLGGDVKIDSPTIAVIAISEG
jgi:hypothetical protein